MYFVCSLQQTTAEGKLIGTFSANIDERLASTMMDPVYVETNVQH